MREDRRHGRVCCIHGYHIYKEIWEAAAGEVLMCERETHNDRDRYAVAACVLATLLAFLAAT